MTKKAADAVAHPPHPTYQYLVGQSFESVEDRKRFKRTRIVTVAFVRDERRIHDRKKRPYAHCVSVVTAASDYAGAQLIGRKKACVISVARLIGTLYTPLAVPPAAPAPSRAEVEAHRVSDGNGGDVPRCAGGHPGACHETPMPPSSADERRGGVADMPPERRADKAEPPAHQGVDEPGLPAEECPV
jgi:hypothetical protein